MDTKSPDYGSRKISSRSFIKKSGNSKDNEMRRQHCAYTMNKIHYNVVRFRDTVSIDEAEVLAGLFNQLMLGIMLYMIQKN